MHDASDTPLKDYSKGEEYTEEEIKKLRERWTQEDIGRIADWIGAGVPKETVPDCMNLLRWDEPVTGECEGYDLRGIDLSGHMKSPRNAASPWIDLSHARLEFANLSNAHLEHACLTWAHLEHAWLFSAHLERVDLVRGNLQHAQLSKADLRWGKMWISDMRFSNLIGANLQYANLSSGTRLDNANLFGAHLEHTDLSGACLKHAELPAARLQHANLNHACLEGADFTQANVTCASFQNVRLDGTVFRDITWAAEAGQLPSPALFLGFDVRGLRYSDPLFDQFVRQSEFVRGCRETWPKTLFWLWRETCNCGRSLRQWITTCAFVVLAFAALYIWANVLGYPLVGAVEARAATATWFTPLYFSIVAFSTLGFGDVTPCSLLGEMLVALEVIFGYLMLGGLISIFTMKLVPPR